MKQMQGSQYKQIKKVDLSMQQLNKDNAPLSPGKSNFQYHQPQKKKTITVYFAFLYLFSFMMDLSEKKKNYCN